MEVTTLGNGVRIVSEASLVRPWRQPSAANREWNYFMLNLCLVARVPRVHACAMCGSRCGCVFRAE